MRVKIYYNEPRMKGKWLNECLRLKGGKRLSANTVSWNQIRKRLLKYPPLNVGPERFVSLIGVLSSTVIKGSNGYIIADLFCSPPGDWKKSDRFENEGLSNHFHMNDIVENPVAQFLLGARLLHAWTSQILQMKGPDSIVLYLNDAHGDSSKWTTCLYSNPDLRNIKRLNEYWPGIKTTSPRKFFSWFLF